MLPEALYNDVLNGVLARHSAGKAIIVDRD